MKHIQWSCSIWCQILISKNIMNCMIYKTIILLWISLSGHNHICFKQQNWVPKLFNWIQITGITYKLMYAIILWKWNVFKISSIRLTVRNWCRPLCIDQLCTNIIHLHICILKRPLHLLSSPAADRAEMVKKQTLILIMSLLFFSRRVSCINYPERSSRPYY